MDLKSRKPSNSEKELRSVPSIRLEQARTVAQVLERLNDLEPLKSAESESWLERQGGRLSKILMRMAVVLFLALCGLAVANYFGVMPRSWVTGALVLAGGSAACAIASMAVQSLVGLVTIVMFKAYSARTRVLECAKDFANASKLHAFSSELLRDADCWLALKQKMIEQRQIFFFGGSEKLALFAMVGVGWIVWKEVSVDLKSWALSPTLIGVCFLAGLALGGMLNRVVLARIEYQRGLVSLALRVEEGHAKLLGVVKGESSHDESAAQ
jgi:hypothetical protein